MMINGLLMYSPRGENIYTVGSIQNDEVEELMINDNSNDNDNKISKVLKLSCKYIKPSFW